MQEQIAALVKVSTPRQLRLLKALVIELISAEVVGQDNALVALVGLENVGSLSAVVPTLPPPAPESLSLLLTSPSDKVQALNSALQLITSVKPNQVGFSCPLQLAIYLSHQVSLLASGFGLRSARKVSTRWCMEADFARYSHPF